MTKWKGVLWWGMIITIETLLGGGKVLVLDKEKSSDGKVLRSIAEAFGDNQYGSMSLSGRLCRVSIPVLVIPRPVNHS